MLTQGVVAALAFWLEPDERERSPIPPILLPPSAWTMPCGEAQLPGPVRHGYAVSRQAGQPHSLGRPLSGLGPTPPAHKFLRVAEATPQQQTNTVDQDIIMETPPELRFEESMQEETPAPQYQDYEFQ